MRSKRGQSEDLFSDLIPAIIILIIGIIIIAKVDATNKIETGRLLSKTVLADRMTVLTLLKAPFDVKAANDAGYVGSFMDFIGKLRLIKETDSSQISKLSDAKLVKFFSYSASSGEVQQSSNAVFQCTENTFWYLNEGFLGNYLTWIVRVYEEDATSNERRLLFICTSHLYDYVEYNNKIDNIVENKKGCYSEGAARYDRAMIYGSLGGKGNSLDRDKEMFSVMVTQPTEDTSKLLSVFVDYSDYPCPLNVGNERVYELKPDN